MRERGRDGERKPNAAYKYAKRRGYKGYTRKMVRVETSRRGGRRRTVGGDGARRQRDGGRETGGRVAEKKRAAGKGGRVETQRVILTALCRAWQNGKKKK